MRPGLACRPGTRKGADPESLWLEAAPSRLAWETGYARVFEQRNVMRGLGCVGDRGAKEAEGGGVGKPPRGQQLREATAPQAGGQRVGLRG